MEKATCAVVIMAAAVITFSAKPVYAKPTWSPTCITSGCHVSDPAVTVTPTLASCDTGQATYQVHVSDTYTGKEGWGVYDNSGRVDGDFLADRDTFTVTDGVNYQVYGISDKPGSGGAAVIGITPDCSTLTPPPGAANDFNNDGEADIFWRNHADGRNYLWYMTGPTPAASVMLPTVSDTSWSIGAVSDFNDDGMQDLLWRNTSSGANAVWIMDGISLSSVLPFPAVADTSWEIGDAADIDGDGFTDILWRNYGTGMNYIWYLDNSPSVIGSAVVPMVADTSWRIMGLADFNSDIAVDILWRHDTTGENVVWHMQNNVLDTISFLPAISNADWNADMIGDFDHNGSPDICWRNYTTGANYIWYMSDTTISGGSSLPVVADTDWHIEQ